MLKINANYEKQPKFPTFDQEIKTVNGTKQIVYTERISDPYEGLSYSDFSLQSLIDAESVDLLQPVGTLSRSQLSIADFAEYCADYIGNTAVDVNSGIVSEKTKNNDEEK